MTLSHQLRLAVSQTGSFDATTIIPVEDSSALAMQQALRKKCCIPLPLDAAAAAAEEPVRDLGLGDNPNKRRPAGAAVEAKGVPLGLFDPEIPAAGGGGGALSWETGRVSVFFLRGTFAAVAFALSKISFGEGLRSSGSSSSSFF